MMHELIMISRCQEVMIDLLTPGHVTMHSDISVIDLRLFDEISYQTVIMTDG